MLKAKNVITLPPDIGIKTTKNIKTRSDCRFVNKFLAFCRKENVELSDVDTTILFISSIIIFGDSSNPSIFSTPRNHFRETTASSGRFLHICKNNKICLQQFSKICRETVFRTKEAAARAASYNTMQDRIISIFLRTHTRLNWRFAFIGLYECNSKM